MRLLETLWDFFKDFEITYLFFKFMDNVLLKINKVNEAH